MNLSMEKLFPTGNQMIDPWIRYANVPGYIACILPSQRRKILVSKKQPKSWLWNKGVCMLQSQVHLHNGFEDLSFVYVRKHCISTKFSVQEMVVFSLNLHAVKLGGGILRTTGHTEVVHLSKFTGFRKENNGNVLFVVTFWGMVMKLTFLVNN